jgi:hypothetical protein
VVSAAAHELGCGFLQRLGQDDGFVDFFDGVDEGDAFGWGGVVFEDVGEVCSGVVAQCEGLLYSGVVHDETNCPSGYEWLSGANCGQWHQVYPQGA